MIFYNLFYVSAKWSSSDDISNSQRLKETNLREGPPVWSADGQGQDPKDFKPIKFDSNSLKKTKKTQVRSRQFYLVIT